MRTCGVGAARSFLLALQGRSKSMVNMRPSEQKHSQTLGNCNSSCACRNKENRPAFYRGPALGAGARVNSWCRRDQSKQILYLPLSRLSWEKKLVTAIKKELTLN